MKRIIAALAGLGVAFVATLAFSAPVSAHTPGITPGAFCSQDDHNHTKEGSDGKDYTCLPDGKGTWHWSCPDGPHTCPAHKAPSPTPSASKSVVVTTSASASTSASTSASGTALPVTGVKTDIIAGVGVLAVVGGVATLWYGHRRRNRVRFTA